MRFTKYKNVSYIYFCLVNGIKHITLIDVLKPCVLFIVIMLIR